MQVFAACFYSGYGASNATAATVAEGSRDFNGGVTESTTREVSGNGAAHVIAAATRRPTLYVNSEVIRDGLDDIIQRRPGTKVFQLGNALIDRPRIKEASDAIHERFGTNDDSLQRIGKRRVGRFFDAGTYEPCVSAPSNSPKRTKFPQNPIISHPFHRLARTLVSVVAGPLVLLRTIDDPGSNGIEVDVSAYFEEVPVLFHDLGMETSLKEMTGATMPSVEEAGIASIEILHPRGEIRLRGLHEEMIVISHQDERVQSPSVRFDRPPQPVKPSLTVRVVLHDVLMRIPARSNMVDRTGELDS